jgi:proton-dependent oligopeptide transporter, POT family
MDIITNPAALSADAGKGPWFGHPSQLARLFSTEAMERFGYYGMRTLLVYYLAQHFQFSGETSGALVGGYLALVYLTPSIGGFCADKYMGYKKAVKFGAIVMAIGYLMLCFGGDPAKPYAMIEGARYDVQISRHEKTVTQYITDNGQKLTIHGNKDSSVSLNDSNGKEVRHIAGKDFKPDAQRDNFYTRLALTALALISLGNGFFKPNISTIVGSLYAPEDRRRDAGYAIFYMGINLGSAFSTLLCPILAMGIGAWEGIGWGAGFGLAAAGMIIAYLLIHFSEAQLKGYGEAPAGATVQQDWIIYACVAIGIPIIYYLLNNILISPPHESGGSFGEYLVTLPLLGKILGGCFVIAIPGILVWAWRVGTVKEAEMMTAAVVLILFNTVFMALFEQAASSLSLFAGQNMDLRIFGNFAISPGILQFANPAFIVILTFAFNWLWPQLRKYNAEPNIAVKFAFGLFGAGLGFLLLVWASHFADASFKVSVWWMVGLYLIHSIGELCIQPVGLSMISKLSMPRVVGLMFGLWFLSIAVAEFAAGALSALASTKTVGGEVTNLQLSLNTYVGSFWLVGLFAIAMGGLLLLLSFPLKRLMHGVQ